MAGPANPTVDFVWVPDQKNKKNLKVSGPQGPLPITSGNAVTLRYQGDEGGVVFIPVKGVVADANRVTPFIETSEGIWEATITILNTPVIQDERGVGLVEDQKPKKVFSYLVYNYEAPDFAEAASPPKMRIYP